LIAVGLGAPPLSEHQVLVFLVQLSLLVGAARVLGALARRLRQPPVVGELLAGVVLGPSVFEPLFPSAFSWVFVSEPVAGSATFAMAWLGVVFLLVVMGFETDLGIISRFRKTALAVAAGSLIAPMLLTGALGLMVADRYAGDAAPWVFASFFALALSVSALPVVGKILQDLGYLRRNFGQVTIAAAMAKDAVGWLLLAVLTGVALGAVDVARILVSFGGLGLFALFAMTLGRWILDGLNRQVLARGSSLSAGVSIAILAALVGSAATQALHVEAILGAYLVGLALGLGRYQVPQTRRWLETVTAAFFAPIFFAYSGLRVDVTILSDPATAAICAGAVALAIAAKVGGSYLSGRWAGVSSRESLALGTGLSPLGVMGVVVAIIGLNANVLNEEAYTILVLAAVFTSLTAPVLLRLVVRGWEPEPEEAERLGRESLLEEAEILSAARVLLPTRGGPDSELAARLISQALTGAEVTVLTITVPRARRFILRRRAQIGSAGDPDHVLGMMAGMKTRVVRRVARDPAEAIVQESLLGYDLLVMGASHADEGGATLGSTVVDRVVGHTGVPTIVLHSGSQPMPGEGIPRRILVPVTASRSSRAAEEFAYSIARAAGSEVTAIHVINRPDGSEVYRTAGLSESAEAGLELARTAREFGSRLGVDVDTEIRHAYNAEQEIIDFAHASNIDLLVLGASSRPLTRLPFFGHRINYMIEHAEVAIAVIALPSREGGAKA
jgi:Kef-type K+ transport system membrane component KefB